MNSKKAKKLSKFWDHGLNPITGFAPSKPRPESVSKIDATAKRYAVESAGYRNMQV